MAVLRLDQRRLLAFADAAGELARAARVEDAAARRMDGAGDLARKPDALAALAIDGGNGGEQRLGIGMMRAREDPLRRADLHQPAEIEDGDAVREIAHDAEIVGDEDIADAA